MGTPKKRGAAYAAALNTYHQLEQRLYRQGGLKVNDWTTLQQTVRTLRTDYGRTDVKLPADRQRRLMGEYNTLKLHNKINGLTREEFQRLQVVAKALNASGTVVVEVPPHRPPASVRRSQTSGLLPEPPKK
ncbi:MAG: hypothetical protein ACYDBB_23125 [Armatimonadota bacterium]